MGGDTVTKNRIRSVNRLFLLTLCIYIAASFLQVPLKTGFLGSLLLSQGSLALPSIIWMIKERISPRSFLRLRKLDLPSILLVLLLAFLLYPTLTLINAVSMLFLKYSISSTLSASSSLVSFPAMFLTVAVVPAILEEVVYRGVLFHTYRQHSIWKGAVLSGFLFGMMHANFNQFFYAFALGFVLALLAEATGSLFSTMLVHLCYNGFSVLVLYAVNYLSSKSESFAGLMQSETQSGVTPEMVVSLLPQAIFFAVLAFFVYRALAKRNGTYELIFTSLRKREKRGSFRKLITIPLVIGTVVLLFLMTINELIAMGILKA